MLWSDWIVVEYGLTGRHVPQRMAPVRAKALNIAEGYRSWLLTERRHTQVSMNSSTNRCELTP
ncbi:MAG: hypothetical protein KUF77_01825 [Candidatus Thiodiazotropha sp. (ex Lucina aurantia)]|nr:hypothetical protein [Candidatus Thiodiazotropha sp. (ex Lucina aurantia)]